MRATNPSNTFQISFMINTVLIKIVQPLCALGHTILSQLLMLISPWWKSTTVCCQLECLNGRATDSVKQIDCKTHFKCNSIINSHRSSWNELIQRCGVIKISFARDMTAGSVPISTYPYGDPANWGLVSLYGPSSLPIQWTQQSRSQQRRADGRRLTFKAYNTLCEVFLTDKTFNHTLPSLPSSLNSCKKIAIIKKRERSWCRRSIPFNIDGCYGSTRVSTTNQRNGQIQCALSVNFHQ